jgi:hypothetical protein
MFRQYFSSLQHQELPLFALGLFILAFALVIARTWFYRTKSDFDPVAALPFADEQSVSADSTRGDTK